MVLQSFAHDEDRQNRRWIWGAFIIALLLHILVAIYFDWIHVPVLAIPANPVRIQSPFQVKRIEVSPQALQGSVPDISTLPKVDPGDKGTQQFDLDPHQVERVLQLPQPTIAEPSLPDPTRVAISTPLDSGVPFAESDKATITKELAHYKNGVMENPTLTTGQLADNLVTTQAGPLQMGTSTGSSAQSSGAGSAPGFAQLMPSFQLPPPDLRNLPDPVLVRLPADVLFDFNSATLRPEAEPLMQQAATMITKYSQANVQVDGYSDAIGGGDYNQTLSEKRAQAVLAWLQAHVSATAFNFTAKGHGASNFVVDPKGSIEQQQQNRRVELLIQALKI